MRTRFAVVGIACVWIAGCSVAPKYHAPAPAPVPQQFKESKDWKVAQPQDTVLRTDWWTLFGDPELNALEQQVNVSNESLKAAAARFDQARALVRVARSGKFPTLTIGGSITTNRNVIRNIGTFGDFLLPIDFSYEVDAFGRVRNQVEAARTEAQASAADLETIRLSLHAELARDHLQLRSLDAEKKLLDDTVAAYERALELTRNRFEGGAASGAEVAQAQTQLEATRTQAADVGVARAGYEHAIAVLTGKAPAALTLAPNPLTGPPPPVPAGVPSQLLERRPDIAAAERRVAEANAEVGIARAAFYPTVILGAALGLEGGSITSWFNWPSRLWAVGPSVLQTVFDGGRRRANSDIARSGYDAQVASYRQTTLDAFQQVEDNIAALRILSQEETTQQNAVIAARRSLELSTNRYQGGLVTYLEVVTAQSTALANERTAVDILRRRMDATVLLIKALGGGYQRS